MLTDFARSNHYVYTDNFYISIAIARKFTITTRKNSAGMPDKAIMQKWLEY